MFTELKNPLSHDYLHFKQIVCGEELQWYWREKTGKRPDNHQDLSFLSHCLLERPMPNESKTSKVTSQWFGLAYKVFDQILVASQVKYHYLTRLNLNMSLPSTIKESYVHTDEAFPHKVFILYMNTFSDGATILKTKDDDLVYYPKEDQAIMFDGTHPHCQMPPRIDERRIALVANFV